MTKGADVLLRSGIEGQELDLLTAALGATDHGVMLTALDHTTLAVNARFGEIWNVDPRRVVTADVSQVRSMVAHRIPDFEAWGRDLDAAYADPYRAMESTINLVEPTMAVRRFTGPFFRADGTLAGRIWTFLDVTAEEWRRKRTIVLQDASLLSHPQPEVVYAKLVDEVAALYGSIAILSIQEERYMRFRSIGAPPGHPVRSIEGNELSDAYCQFCLRDGPLIVQDARSSPSTANLFPARHGFTRYAGVPVRAPNGDPIGTLCILDTRSEEMLGEEDLTLLGLIAMRISSELERERQLTQLQSDLAVARAQVIQNEKLATAGTLSATIAHDIRNILSALRLEMSGSDDRFRAVAVHLDRFSLLSHRLLSYAKPQRVSLTQVNVSDSIGRVLALMSRHLELGKVHLEASVRHDLPMILADPARLDHLFVNLILNALQAMGGGGTLGIDTWFEDGKVFVAVRDTGHGMSQADLDNLFLPFNSKKQDGFGLGLYSAQQIALESGGMILVESVPGQGTSFVLEVPEA